MTAELTGQLRRDVERLAGPNGRLVGSAGHAEARAFLVERLESLGLEPYSGTSFELPYRDGNIDFCNIVGRISGSDPSLPPVTLVAHYDSCGPLPGADDNAAAIAVWLALAPRLAERRLARSIILAFPDAEEPPHYLTPAMGSVHYYHHQRKEECHCALVLDLVGHDVPVPGLESGVFITGMESDPGLESIVVDCSDSTALKTVPTLNKYIGDMSDYHAFRVDHRPYLFFSCGQWEHYHSETDTPEKLNYDKMASLVDYLFAITERVCDTALEGPFEGYDTTPTEIRLLTEHLGPLLHSFDLTVENRRDIDLVVSNLRRFFAV